MPRYECSDPVEPFAYLQLFKDKMSRLDKYEHADMEHIKSRLINQIKGLGDVGADELILKLSAFLNSQRVIK